MRFSSTGVGEIMKLRITIVSEVNFHNLRNYEAKTIEEAVANMARWFEDGHIDLWDEIDLENAQVKFEAVNPK
jgi:hypothetical protein